MTKEISMVLGSNETNCSQHVIHCCYSIELMKELACITALTTFEVVQLLVKQILYAVNHKSKNQIIAHFKRLSHAIEVSIDDLGNDYYVNIEILRQ